MDDVLGLRAVGGGAVHVNLHLFAEVGDQRHVLVITVAGDYLRGRVQNRLWRPIIAVQVLLQRTREVTGEREEVAVVRPAKAVDRLVRVADDAQVCTTGDQ